MGNMFGMFLFAFCIVRALECEAVNFPKFKPAGITIRLFKYLDTPILIIAHMPCMRVRDAHAHRDVTRFAYDANHITMTSLVFAFHSCHVEMRWHDVISVHIVGTPCHHGLHRQRHDIIMFSSCLHHVDDVITFRS